MYSSIIENADVYFKQFVPNFNSLQLHIFFCQFNNRSDLILWGSRQWADQFWNKFQNIYCIAGGHYMKKIDNAFKNI